MNYLWEIALEAERVGIKASDIRFLHAEKGSPYMELSLEYLNQEDIPTNKEIEVNTYYRFYSIFKNAYQPERNENKELLDSLTNLILHILTENDVRKGMTKKEYYKKMLKNNIISHVFGEDAKTAFLLFDRNQQEQLVEGWIRAYQTGSSLTLFTDMIHQLIRDSIIYHSNDSPNEIMLYTSDKKTWELEQRLQLIVDTFLDIRYQVEIFYEYHFGILGVNETMVIDEIALY